jgi:DNA-binding CsgD family transcriptional regulator
MKPQLLSPKEHGVLQYLSKGFRYAEIAAIEGVNLCTVQTYVRRIYAKLAVHSRSEAVFEAQSCGLIVN